MKIYKWQKNFLNKVINKKSCIGCKDLIYLNDGSADCLKGQIIYYVCPKTNFKFREEENKGVDLND